VRTRCSTSCVTLLRTAARVWHDDSMQRDAHLLASYQRAIGGAWDDWDSAAATRSCSRWESGDRIERQVG